MGRYAVKMVNVGSEPVRFLSDKDCQFKHVGEYDNRNYAARVADSKNEIEGENGEARGFVPTWQAVVFDLENDGIAIY